MIPFTGTKVKGVRGERWDTRGGTAVAPRLTDADPASLVDATGENLDPDRVWSAMMANEKPGGHGGCGPQKFVSAIFLPLSDCARWLDLA